MTTLWPGSSSCVICLAKRQVPGHVSFLAPYPTVVLHVLSSCFYFQSLLNWIILVSFKAYSRLPPIESRVGWVETTVSQPYILLKPSHSLLPFLETSRKNIYTCGLYLLTSHSLLRSLSGWVLTHQPNQTACAEVLPLPWPPNSSLPRSPLLLLQPLSFLGFNDTRLFWFPLSSDS